MTESEAKKHLQICKASRMFIPNDDVLELAIQALEEIQQCRTIGTVEEFKRMKEKKAKWEFDSFTAKFGNPYRCSNCNEEFEDTYNYCPNCGCDMYAD